MNSIVSPVEQHYSQPGIFESIVAALQDKGLEKITREDLSPYDEMHVRGAAVSVELAEEAALGKAARVLDIGCGIGGAGRMLAALYGCNVTGIDLTAEFIRTARLLSRLVGLNEMTEYIQADALQLPFQDKRFDVVWTQHVQMNIAQKTTFYAEIKRVLKKEGVFIYYDIFSRNGQALRFPVPWAGDESMSHLITTDELDRLLIELGFIKIRAKDQNAAAIQSLTAMLNKKTGYTSPLFDRPMRNGNAAESLLNLLENIRGNIIELQSGIYRLK